MPPQNEWLRALGYVLDQQDRWVHPRLGIAALRPELLKECDADQVEAFHDRSVWIADDDPPVAPLLPRPLQTAARELGVVWRGWLEAWETPAGVFLGSADLLRLGGEGLRSRMERWRRWRAERGLRSLFACVGMGAMWSWIAAGWLAGLQDYLMGTATIAVITWTLRPQPAPEDLWEGLDTGLLERKLAATRELLGPAWAPLASALNAVALDGERLYLGDLNRIMSLRDLRERLTPEGVLEILDVVVPVAELEDS